MLRWNAVFCLLITGICGITEVEINDIGLEGNLVEQKENLRWPKVFEVFEVCNLSCQGKSCWCCHHVLNVVPVCGTLYIDPTAKTAEISLTLTGSNAFSAVFSIIPFLNYCHTTETKLGDADFCGNATITEHETNPDSFRLCIEGEVYLNKVKHFHVILNCLEFNGDIIFENDDETKPGKIIASVRILNQLILANVIRKAITDRFIG